MWTKHGRIRSLEEHAELYAKGLVLLAAIFVIVYIVLFFFWEGVRPVKLLEHGWHTDRIVNEYRMLRVGGGLKSKLPSDSYNVHCWIDRGDDDDDDVERCNYNIDRWVYSHRIRTTGLYEESLTVAEPVLLCPNEKILGCQNYAGYNTYYWAKFADGVQGIFCEYDKSTWEKLIDGYTYEMIFGQLHGELRCGLWENEK